MLVLRTDVCGACAYPIMAEADRCSECGAIDRRTRRLRCVARPGLGAWSSDVLLAHGMLGRRTRLEVDHSGVIAVGVLNVVLGCGALGLLYGSCAMLHTLFEDGIGSAVWMFALLPMLVAAAAAVLSGATLLLASLGVFVVYLQSRVGARSAPSARWVEAFAHWSFFGLQIKAVLSVALLCVLGPLAEELSALPASVHTRSGPCQRSAWQALLLTWW